MHRFLRSIGFSTYQKKREIEKLLAELEQTGTRRRIQIDTDTNLCEVRAEVAPGMGLVMMGEDVYKRQALEDAVAGLDDQIAESATNYGKLNQLMAEKAEKEAQLEEKMERWMYLNELAEQIAAQS